MDTVAPAVRAATQDAIAAAADLLRGGRLVAFPTETVYGLGADATNARAVAGIYAAKTRPRFNPLIVHVGGLAQAEELVQFNTAALRLARAFWPGGLTLALPRRHQSPVADLVSAGLDTIAVRAPSHPVARALLAAVDRPLAAPSANRSGRISPTDAQAVAEELGGAAAVILDGGACTVGLESTVVGFADDRPVLLRPGAVPRDAIEALIGPLGSVKPDLVVSPGMLPSHYAPEAALRLNARSAEPGEALLAFGPDVPATAATVCNLSPRGDLAEAAANLFAMLRRLDSSGASRIAVMPIPDTGLGEAINDRLRRAAAPRDR
jgi:L-threonylcarbamoyladenylate synthase